MLFCFVWVRASVPRFRYDQLMDLGWKVLIPVGLGWLLILVAFRVGNELGWHWYAVFPACVAIDRRRLRTAARRHARSSGATVSLEGVFD